MKQGYKTEKLFFKSTNNKTKQNRCKWKQRYCTVIRNPKSPQLNHNTVWIKDHFILAYVKAKELTHKSLHCL